MHSLQALIGRLLVTYRVWISRVGGLLVLAFGLYLLGIFKAMPIVPFNLPESMKPVQTVPAFFGTSIVMQPEYGSFDFFLPVTAVHEVRKVLMPLFTGE